MAHRPADRLIAPPPLLHTTTTATTTTTTATTNPTTHPRTHRTTNPPSRGSNSSSTIGYPPRGGRHTRTKPSKLVNCCMRPIGVVAQAKARANNAARAFREYRNSVTLPKAGRLVSFP